MPVRLSGWFGVLMREGTEMDARYKDGDAVRINKPTLREHGVTGTVKSYDEETQWYWVELDKGPPWRGKYEHGELETPNEH